MSEALWWPLSVCGAVVIIVIAVLVSQPAAVGELLRRLVRVKSKAGDFEFVRPPQSQDALPPTATVASTDIPDLTRELGSLVDSQLIDMRVTMICAEFESRDIPNGTREGALTTLLAAALAREWLEQINFLIFGSQLVFLRTLNERPPMSPEEIRTIYQEAADNESYSEVYPSFTFEQWLGFLEGIGFIEIVDEGRYRITTAGRAFLKFLVARGYPSSRAF